MIDSFTITCNQCQIQIHTEKRSNAIVDHGWIYDGDQWWCDACYMNQQEPYGVQS